MLRFIILVICLVCGDKTIAQTPDANLHPPDSIQIGALQNIFNPVPFAHKLHADMTSMGGSCETCHHHASDQVYEPCSECHLSDTREASLAMPTLNGAYHRNCLNCHQDWNNNRVCKTCHTPRKIRFNPRKALDSTDVMLHAHEEILIPELFHFITPDSEEKPVVFHHKEHVDLYRYKCEHCHRQTNCSKCHNYVPHAKEYVSELTVHHNPCDTCHDTEAEEDCSHCHTGNPPDGFTHILTGWELKEYHIQLTCNQCHEGDDPITELDNTCTSCHTNFEQGEFDHSSTKLVLNEDHLEIDCYECHVDDRYDTAPSCIECHEDEVNYPPDLPGEFLSNQ